LPSPDKVWAKAEKGGRGVKCEGGVDVGHVGAVTHTHTHLVDEVLLEEGGVGLQQLRVQPLHLLLRRHRL
jgi:hypothetical protein